MKPTDIWNNCPTWLPKPACQNGDKCHVSAPRGSRTGTQGIKGAKFRSVIPEALCMEIIMAIEEMPAFIKRVNDDLRDTRGYEEQLGDLL